MEEQQHPHTTPMEEIPRSSSPTEIIRKSIHEFRENYHYFTFTSALFAFPYSISFLLSQYLVLSSSSPSTSSIFRSLYAHFRTLFEAGNFPAASSNFANIKLSQTISSSIISLPFALTFLLISKALVFQLLTRTISRTASSVVPNYFPILRTYICTWLVLLSTNATVFFLLFFAFNAFERIPVSQTQSSIFTALILISGVVVYSVVVANAMAVCGVGLALSGVEGVGGSDAIIKACILMRGRASTAVSLAVLLNLAFAAMEALFQLRVTRPSFHGSSSSLVAAAEGIFIGYVYSVLIVLEAIVACVFYKSCCTSVGSYNFENPEDDSNIAKEYMLL